MAGPSHNLIGSPYINNRVAALFNINNPNLISRKPNLFLIIAHIIIRT